MRGVRRLGWVMAAAGTLTGGGAAQGGAAPEFEYERDPGTYHAVVTSIRERAAGDPILFVFDAATIDPPPGRNEFRSGFDLPGEGGTLEVWCKAIHDVWGPATERPHVATTISTQALPFGLAAWNEIAHQLVDASWWDDRAFRAFTPADRVLPRLARRVPGDRRVVVLVTGDVLPETRLRRPPFDRDAGSEPWRRKLLDTGAYWDEERVGAELDAAGARLFVVAPPARFGDFLPREEIPEAPWASRPRAGGPPGFERDPRPIVDAGPLEEALRARGATAEEIREALEQFGAAAAKIHPATPGSRFTGSLPSAFPVWGVQRPFVTDAPSGYGKWEFARAAARTGGAYYFHPGFRRGHGDALPLDPALAEALAPELIPAAQFAVRRKQDQALAAMLDAQRIVFDSTPWADDAAGPTTRHATSWCGFGTGNAPADGWRPREKPWDALFADARSPLEWRALGRSVAGAAADYDRAIRVLADAQAKLAAGELPGTCRRSEANLRLCRFWSEMSAFHLEALAIYLSEIDRWLPKDAPGRDVRIRPAVAFRLSDCLDAYDGATVDAKTEARRGFVEPPERSRGAQSNLLDVPETDPAFRARRDVDSVLLHLDRRLRPRAVRTIAAARDVMAHEARSGWGWTVYSTDALTFVWEPAPKGDDPSGR